MKKFLFCCLVAVLTFGMAASAAPKQKKLTTTVFVTDIDCEHCKKKIMDNIPVLGKGIEDVTVDVPTKRVTVTYDATKTDTQTIIQGFAKLRVKATPAPPPPKKE